MLWTDRRGAVILPNMPMPESERNEIANRQKEQMLRLVSRGFYNELINYGVKKHEVVKVASHLLDHLMEAGSGLDREATYYNRHFSLATLRDEWKTGKRLSVHEVSIEPLPNALHVELAGWLDAPRVRASFVEAFPGTVADMAAYFSNPGRCYFSILYQGAPVGIIGAEHMDGAAGRLEMRKLVGRGDLRGRGIGKRATFAFLFYVFQILNFEKVYVHSTDVNIRNLNLNSQFGFQLEGVFLQEIRVPEGRADIVRMGLLKARWLEIFSNPGGSD